MENACGNLGIMGAAAPDAATLAAVAGAAMHGAAQAVLSVRAARIEMPTPNMTTGGLWRVQRTAALAAGDGNTADSRTKPFSVVAKLIQSPLLWHGIGQVPPGMREELASQYLWRTEAEIYASRLAEVVPGGGRLPDVLGLCDVDPQRTVIWMEDVQEHPDASWSDEVFAQAAHWLGRLAGSRAVRANWPQFDEEGAAGKLRFYVHGVGAHVLVPSLLGEDLWRLPSVAPAATPDLVAGLRALAVRAGDIVEEMLAMPQLPSHGDACPQNLVIESGRDGPAQFVAIDWGLAGPACPGFDLSQLLAGHANDGRLPAEAVHRLEPQCLGSYCEGLAQSGSHVDKSAVRRGHALSLALFTGLFTLVTPRLEEPDSPELHAFMAQRLAMGRFALDLLAETD
ncbi:tRNA A-37 threonylcarbamoyl transferase component Bud32 [Arthrobacter stackebrandtii]|uniref:tRNA A-37 threonylcarbamoyl transferase component Bud32 n=1 Tax=Arthrobacter stackebrandtii TaxID=272161 RepID=A0ABS4Z1V7_9MICC|nr:phosphotransferase [Arthrobacter stackebrandtii]MBP2414710.1 tRNA A-37 threonylcarbamoyl transferase component Bud32 [Arthrobacter stackebrandtii]